MVGRIYCIDVYGSWDSIILHVFYTNQIESDQFKRKVVILFELTATDVITVCYVV